MQHSRTLRRPPLSGLLLGIGTLLFACYSGCGSNSKTPFDLSQAKFVGQASCVECHREEVERFSGSHHDQAMQPATDSTVLGDFANASIEHHGVVSRFFRDGDKFMVNTEGPDGELSDFHIKYVFGLEPLQQYMIEFPGSDGPSQENSSVIPRVQVLRLCWDTQNAKWFYLPPPDVPDKLDPHDDLHWTGIAQRWNTMCAECHSTDFQKNFEIPAQPLNLVGQQADATLSSDGFKRVNEVNGNYHSTFFEINVSCEACHGPASVHLELAKKSFPGWSRERGYGLANLKATAENQIQACAPCHSRRNVVQAGFRAGDNYYDHYTNQLLTENVYYPDGQILDEDYVHGSFIQSKMYHKGIRCSDCHDPHSARLKHEGNAVCTSCHQHPAAKYDSVAHHFHKSTPGAPAEQDGTLCVNCHMPSTTYMAVDARRDHSLRVPRPDISLATGSPNACTGCHLNSKNVAPDKLDHLPLYQDWMLAARQGDAEVQAELDRVNQWCDDACEEWYGENRRRDEHFGFAIAAGQKGEADAKDKLQRVLGKRGFESPALARATALEVLSQVDPAVAGQEAVRAIKDEHPLVRSAAASALLGNASQSQSIRLLEAALQDPIRSVRTEAVRNLLNFPAALYSNEASAAFRKALDELIEGLQYNNDRAGAHLTLGILAEQQAHFREAIKHYETAIAVEPEVAGPRTNLAALLENNNTAGPSVDGKPNSIEQIVRQLRKAELPLLERDVRLLPDAASIQYRLGLALYVDGQQDRAVEHLVLAAELEPDNVGFAQAAAMLFESLTKWDEAVRWAEEAVRRPTMPQSHWRYSSAFGIIPSISLWNKHLDSFGVEQRSFAERFGNSPAGPLFPKMTTVRFDIEGECHR
jgi:tetratricopeptide (TPR) repeat protein